MSGHTNITLDFPFESILTASIFQHEETKDDRANSNADAEIAVNFADAEDITNSSVADFEEYLSAFKGQPSIAAFFQGESKIRCLGWPIRPAWRFADPFTSKKKDNGDSKLSTPILFMGNKIDPMMNLHTVRTMVKGFPGSAVLEQNARGHRALGNAVPSPCSLMCLREHSLTGIFQSLVQSVAKIAMYLTDRISNRDCECNARKCLLDGIPKAVHRQ